MSNHKEQRPTNTNELGKRRRGEPTTLRGVFARRGKWWISWCCTEGHRHRQPIGPHGLAVQEHGARRKEVERAQRLGLPFCPDVERKQRQAKRRERILFKEIAQDFLDYAKAHKRDRCDKFRMERLLSVFGEKLVSDITPEDVERYKANPPLQKTRRGRAGARAETARAGNREPRPRHVQDHLQSGDPSGKGFRQSCEGGPNAQGE